MKVEPMKVEPKHDESAAGRETPPHDESAAGREAPAPSPPKHEVDTQLDDDTYLQLDGGYDGTEFDSQLDDVTYLQLVEVMLPDGRPVPRHRSCGYCGRPGWPNVWCPWRMCLATFCSASCRRYHCRDIHARNPRAGVWSMVTATEFDNQFALTLDDGTQPDMQACSLSWGL